jgi:hypothetical protein
MKITKITIGRLFNLGSYEHIRFELTCEVGERESAARAYRAMEVLIESLNPKRPSTVPSLSEIQRDQLRIEEARKMDAEQFRRMHGEPTGGKAAYLKRCAKHVKEGQARRKKWEAHRKHARALFDNLGGISHYRDAKQDWDDVDF